MSVMSNLLTTLKAFSAWSGAINQLTMAETPPARTAAASSYSALITSKRRLVMFCVQVKLVRPPSGHPRIAGPAAAPRQSRRRTG